MRTIRLLLVGVGNLGRRFCQILAAKEGLLRDQYGLSLVLVGAADSRGAAYDPQGLDPARVAALKSSGASVSAYEGAGHAEWDAVRLVLEAEAEVLLEASPVNLTQGGDPGLTCIRLAMQKGMHISTPNKGPLVLAFQELVLLAAENNVQFRFDGAVAGGLPAINLGQRDLRGAIVDRIEAVPNLVTGYVMDMLTEGLSWDEALKHARDEGVLEADASWDLDGWDAAAKLVILTNAVLGYPARLADVRRTGIQILETDDLYTARERGYRYRLLAQAERRQDGSYALSVAPVPLSPEHPLGNLGRKQMGIVYMSDIFGTITAIIEEQEPIPSAASLLRDVLDIVLSPSVGAVGKKVVKSRR
ncbi:MAG: homoserine dehydrogenase [Anaerolineae bacterium]|nr:homoserine dehydrogenase [Anaerolineae bacterium]